MSRKFFGLVTAIGAGLIACGGQGPWEEEVDIPAAFGAPETAPEHDGTRSVAYSRLKPCPPVALSVRKRRNRATGRTRITVWGLIETTVVRATHRGRQYTSRPWVNPDWRKTTAPGMGKAAVFDIPDKFDHSGRWSLYASQRCNANPDPKGVEDAKFQKSRLGIDCSEACK